MKKMRDLKGMVVLTLREGEQLGRISGMLVDPDSARVVALVLNKRTPSGELQVIATANIYRVGEAAITVEDRGAMVAISRIPRFQTLAQTKSAIRGKAVLTEEGENLGRVADVLIDAETFEIQAVLLKAFLREGRRIPAEQIRTIGPDVLVVQKETPAPPPHREPRPPEPEPEILAEADFTPDPAVTEGRPSSLEPAMPPLSTPERIVPVEPPPVSAGTAAEGDEGMALTEEAPPDPALETALETAVEEPSEAAAVEEEEENPWRRWVKRLRGGEAEGYPGEGV
ncbi:MAG: PRC-barrel domain-containing protein [Chloroflexia bacterium]|nr:PRC-barrel domain-containing protein [Chloroflexia bacterium]